jgi:hypothetical protein
MCSPLLEMFLSQVEVLQMCSPATCRRCGKATYLGCGQHVDQALQGVPRSQRCTCATQGARCEAKAVQLEVRQEAPMIPRAARRRSTASGCGRGSTVMAVRCHARYQQTGISGSRKDVGAWRL